MNSRESALALYAALGLTPRAAARRYARHAAVGRARARRLARGAK